MTEEFRNRLLRLYTGAVADILDHLGHTQQVLPAGILPLDPKVKVAGPAFPVYGLASHTVIENSLEQLLAMLERVRPGQVCVVSCGPEQSAAQWGEIMSRAVMEQGCAGAVVDGGLRDSQFVLELQFPIFSRYRSPASSVGRWHVVGWECDITIGATTVHPGDWVFGDIDGVVIIPADRLAEVVETAEAKASREVLMRQELAKGARITDVYARYGKF